MGGKAGTKREHRRLVGALLLSVCYFSVRFSPELGKTVHAEVEHLRHLYAGAAPHVALDEACHLVGRKLEGTDICHGPPRGH